MRKKFEDQLNELNNSLIEMSAMVEHAIALAVKALQTRDSVLAKQVIESDTYVNQKEKEIESICLKLILHQQPMAGDLRMISTALKVITDLERIGDHAGDISEISLLLCETDNIMVFDHIFRMAEITVKMLTDSIDAYVKKDLVLAGAVIARDDEVDNLFLLVKQDILELLKNDRNSGESAMDFLIIAKYLERVGDHAVNIAEWVVFSITGRHKDAQVL